MHMSHQSTVRRALHLLQSALHLMQSARLAGRSSPTLHFSLHRQQRDTAFQSTQTTARMTRIGTG